MAEGKDGAHEQQRLELVVGAFARGSMKPESPSHVSSLAPAALRLFATNSSGPARGRYETQFRRW
jgi:hypothetical protein